MAATRIDCETDPAPLTETERRKLFNSTARALYRPSSTARVSSHPKEPFHDARHSLP